MTKLEHYKKYGYEICKHHGEHNEWKIMEDGRKSLECKKCINERVYKWNKSNTNYQDMYRYSKKGTITRILSQARSRAKKRGLIFELDKDWMFETLVKQNNKCAYSNVLFSFDNNFNGNTRYYIPSIDQVVAGNGYTKNNSVLVLAVVNRMKQEIPLELFKELCAYIMKT